MSEAKQLWAVLIQGPDEMYAMESEEKARDAARRINEALVVVSERGDMPPGYKAHAIATPWIHSREAHAADLKETFEEHA